MADAAIREFLSGVDAGTTGGAPVTRNTGAGTAIGDLLVVAHGIDFYDATMPAPTGTAGTWTERFFADGGADQAQLKIWTRPVTVAGAQTVTVANQNDAANFLALWVVSGTDLTVVDADGQAPSIASTSLVMPSQDLDTAPGLQLAAVLTEAAGAVNHTYTTSGLTKDVELDAATFSTMSAGHAALSSSGATGTRTVTSSASRKYGFAGIVVRAGASANEGSLAASGLLPTASATGSVTAAGQVAGSAPAPTASIAATSTADGTVASGPPPPAAELAGVAAATGTLAGSAPAAAFVATGATATGGALDTAAPGATLSAAGTVTSTGGLSATAPAATAGATGTARTGGTLSASPVLPAASFAADASIGTLAAQAPPPVVGFSGTARSGGVLAAEGPTPAAAVVADALNIGLVAAGPPLPTVALTTAGVLSGVLVATAPQASSALQAAARTSGVLAASAPLPTVDLFSVVPTTPGSMTPVYRAGPGATGTARQAPSAAGTHRGAPTATRG